MINKYELNARIYPVIIILLPLLIVGIYFSIDYQTLYSALGSLGLIALLSFVLGQLGRDRGKRAEKKLWDEWGGTPTTQILRLSDDVIDNHSTKRAHKILNEKTGIGQPDMQDVEDLDSNKSDEVYTAWVNYLRGQTRDNTNYKLLFKENINYGFRRNLWGLKPIGIFLTLLSVIVICAHAIITCQIYEIPNYPLWFSLGLLFVILCFFIFTVTKNWIKTVAFAYAKMLIEAIES
jgi:hypothetical protein